MTAWDAVGEWGEAKERRRARLRPSSAADRPSAIQWIVAWTALASVAAALYRWPGATIAGLHALLVLGFALSASSKLVLAAIGRPPRAPARLRRDLLPTYSILAPLYREGAVVDQLVQALSEIDYPANRLQIILILEPDDTETLDALAWMQLPRNVEVLINPSPAPRTKPNALNAALPLVRGQYVVVYDAEDRPHPGQLREAAARFAAEPEVDCLQAPLRIVNADAGLISRQFALEYAGQFEAVIPGLVRLGAPFPLGGTSNHFRVEALRRMGGWDAYNVTEDADIGYRIAAAGGRSGCLSLPTLEDAPVGLEDWLPQRTRWVKGYMQTWGVHMRRPSGLGGRGLASLQATLGAAILGAALHGPLVLALVASILMDALGGLAPLSLLGDVGVLGVGWAMAVTANLIGARRAGLRMTLLDGLASLIYWPLLSIAFLFAVRQLVVAPHHWDKTAHTPWQTPQPAPPLDAAAGWSVSRAA